MADSKQTARDLRPLDMNQPIYSIRHVARLWDKDVDYASKHIITAPWFPAARQPPIGKSGTRTMSKSWLRDEVIDAYTRQEPVLSKSA